MTDDKLKLNTKLELTAEEIAAIHAEVEKEIAKETKDKLKKELKDSLKSAAKKKALFADGKNEEGENLVSVTLNLASHAPDIKLDGKMYRNGVTYQLTPKTAAVINEIAYRGWLHDAEVHGLDTNEFLGRQKTMSIIR
jgi:hypothetical protein